MSLHTDLISNKLTGFGSLLILISVVITAARCDEEKPFAAQQLTFILPVTIQPTDSLALLGDTIWIEAAVPDSLLEFNTNKKYKLPNFDFGQTSIVIRKLIDSKKGLSDQKSAVSNFDLIDKTRLITFPGDTFIDFKFKYDPTGRKYLLRIGIVAKSQGVYCINFLSPTDINYNGILNLGKSTNGATIIPVYEDLVFPINEGVNNFNLFKKHCLDESEGLITNYRTNYRYVTFTFRVI